MAVFCNGTVAILASTDFTCLPITYLWALTNRLLRDFLFWKVCLFVSRTRKTFRLVDFNGVTVSTKFAGALVKTRRNVKTANCFQICNVSKMTWSNIANKSCNSRVLYSSLFISNFDYFAVVHVNFLLISREWSFACYYLLVIICKSNQ